MGRLALAEFGAGVAPPRPVPVGSLFCGEFVGEVGFCLAGISPLLPVSCRGVGLTASSFFGVAGDDSVDAGSFGKTGIGVGEDLGGGAFKGVAVAGGSSSDDES